MIELKFKTWFPADPAIFQAAHMTEPWTIEDIALNYDGGECMYFGTEKNPDNKNDLIGLVSYSDKNKNYANRNYVKRQYTGRKDKNGVEIYDGDIIRLGDGDAFYVEYNACGAYLLRWQQEMFNHNQGMLADFAIREIEIIGNIYQNPELIDESLRGNANETN